MADVVVVFLTALNDVCDKVDVALIDVVLIVVFYVVAAVAVIDFEFVVAVCFIDVSDVIICFVIAVFVVFVNHGVNKNNFATIDVLVVKIIVFINLVENFDDIIVGITRFDIIDVAVVVDAYLVIVVVAFV